MKPQVIQIAIVTSCSYINTVNPHLHTHVHEDFGAYSELKETKCYSHLKGFWGRWASCLSHYTVLTIKYCGFGIFQYLFNLNTSAL